MSFDLKPSLDRVGQYLTDEMRKELEAQGHIATGRLLRSVEYVAGIFGNDGRVDVYYEDYGNPVDTGVSAGRIPFSPGSGRKVSRYIQGLAEWVAVKGMASRGSREALSIAFAIAHTHKREGMPSRGSYAFSTNGRRTGWVSEVLKTAEQRAFEILEDEIGQVLARTMDVVIDRIQRDFQQAA